MNPPFISNVITLMICWAPIFGLVINCLPPFLKKNHVYLMAASSLVVGILVFLFEPFRAIDFEFSKVYAMYCFYLFLALWVLPKKYSLQQSVAISLMLVFLISELHELPAFVQMYLGIFDSVNARQEYLVWFTPINHLYTLVVGVLMFSIAKIKLNWSVGFLMVLAFFETWIVYEMGKSNIYGIWQYCTRIIWLICLMGILLMGDRKN